MSAAASDVPPHQAFLSVYQVKDLVHAQQDVVHGSEETSVEEAMNILKHHNILSLPIFDKQKKQYVGLVNLFDIVTAVAFQKLFDNYGDSKLDEVTEQVFSTCQKLEIWKTPVASLLGVSQESTTLWSFDESDGLKDLLAVFSRGIHRVLVRYHSKMIPAVGTPAPDAKDTGSHGYVRVLSQTDVVRFIHFNANNSQLSPVMEKSIAQAGLLNRSSPADSKEVKRYHVITLSSSSTALTGFQKLTMHDISGLALVDKDGKLVGTLSTSDMRGITKNEFKNVLLPVMDFLKQKHGEIPLPVTFSADDKLVDVINGMLSNRVHRVWVVDGAGKPVDVITHTDIIHVFSPWRNPPVEPVSD